MYVQGVSTRNVKAITEQLCGVEVSSPVVSQAAKQLDGQLEKWRNRPLDESPFLFLNAYYEQSGKMDKSTIWRSWSRWAFPCP